MLDSSTPSAGGFDTALAGGRLQRRGRRSPSRAVNVRATGCSEEVSDALGRRAATLVSTPARHELLDAVHDALARREAIEVGEGVDLEAALLPECLHVLVERREVGGFAVASET